METKFSADQIIAQELAKMQMTNKNSKTNGDNDMSGAEDLEKDIYQKLAAPFPKDAFSCDSSRGFDLTSIKAQYVIERLNEVLGLMNWSHGGEYEVTDNGVLFKGALIITIDGKQNRFFGTGFSSIKKNLGDSYKSAKTDSLSKCASQIGVGNDVFKGLIDPKTFERVQSKNGASTVKVSQTESLSTTTKTVTTETQAVPSMFKLKSTQKVSGENTTTAATPVKKGL